MERNYKKEFEWAKQKYKRYELRLNKDLADIFDSKLKSENKSYPQWVREKINEYINS